MDAQATAAAIVDAVSGEEPFDLLLFGNESADAGNYQVGIRVAYALGLPVVTGLKKIELRDGRARVERDAGGARDVYEVPLPAVLTVLEGLNLPRYPSVPGRLRAKSKPLASSSRSPPESKLEKLRLVVAGGPGQAGRGPRQRRRRGAEGRRGHAAARCRMSVLLFVEPDDELSLQALTLARSLGDVQAVSVDGAVRARRRGRRRSPPQPTAPTRSSPPAPTAATSCSRTSPRASTSRSRRTSPRSTATS